jgi:hypothetical protein
MLYFESFLLFEYFRSMCYGITQDPNIKDYMMVLPYFDDGKLRNILMNDLNYSQKLVTYVYYNVLL